MLKFQNTAISISGQTFLAESVSISESNSIAPISFMGFKGPFPSSPNGGINNSISFDYVLENTDINYKLINRIRNYDFNSFPALISVAGLSGMGYPNNYSLSITPNNAIRASITYSIYSELSGQLQEQQASNSQNYNLANGSGIGHYWTTYAKTNSGNLTGSLLELNYSFNLEWAARYRIGNPNPTAVKFIGAIEQFDILSEYENRVLYSGQNFTGKFTNFEILEINPLSVDWGITGQKIILYPSSGKITSNKINISENNLILNETSTVKYW